MQAHEEQSYFKLNAGASDTTVLLVCGGNPPLLLHCLAGQSHLFWVPQCATTLSSVVNVKETA